MSVLPCPIYSRVLPYTLAGRSSKIKNHDVARQRRSALRKNFRRFPAYTHSRRVRTTAGAFVFVSRIVYSARVGDGDEG